MVRKYKCFDSMDKNKNFENILLHKNHYRGFNKKLIIIENKKFDKKDNNLFKFQNTNMITKFKMDYENFYHNIKMNKIKI